MNKEHPLNRRGIIFSCLGGLFTILGTTVFDEQRNIQLLMLIGGVVLAFYGLVLIQKAKKQKVN